MKTENNKAEKNIEEGFDWFGKAEGIVMGFLKGLLKIGVETINERVREFYALVRKNIAGSFVIMVGSIFLLVGLAIFINDLLGISQGIGYAIIGIIAVLTGLVIIKKNNMATKNVKKQVEAMKKKMQQMTAKELKRAKVEMAKAAKKVEDFIKKNPEKAAIVAAGIGAAVGAAITAMVAGKKKKK